MINCIKSTIDASTALPRALNSHPREGGKNRHQSHRCQVTHKRVNHWLLLLFTVDSWSPSFPQPLLTPSGLQLAHFISAEKSTAPRCSDKRSVLMLITPVCAGEIVRCPQTTWPPPRAWSASPAAEMLSLPQSLRFESIRRKRTLRGTQTEMAGRKTPALQSTLVSNWKY